jgi:hypothetical protein
VVTELEDFKQKYEKDQKNIIELKEINENLKKDVSDLESKSGLVNNQTGDICNDSPIVTNYFGKIRSKWLYNIEIANAQYDYFPKEVIAAITDGFLLSEHKTYKDKDGLRPILSEDGAESLRKIHNKNKNDENGNGIGYQREKFVDVYAHSIGNPMKKASDEDILLIQHQLVLFKKIVKYMPYLHFIDIAYFRFAAYSCYISFMYAWTCLNEYNTYGRSVIGEIAYYQFYHILDTWVQGEWKTNERMKKLNDKYKAIEIAMYAIMKSYIGATELDAIYILSLSSEEIYTEVNVDNFDNHMHDRGRKGYPSYFQRLVPIYYMGITEDGPDSFAEYENIKKQIFLSIRLAKIYDLLQIEGGALSFTKKIQVGGKIFDQKDYLLKSKGLLHVLEIGTKMIELLSNITLMDTTGDESNFLLKVKNSILFIILQYVTLGYETTMNLALEHKIFNSVIHNGPIESSDKIKITVKIFIKNAYRIAFPESTTITSS